MCSEIFWILRHETNSLSRGFSQRRHGNAEGCFEVERHSGTDSLRSLSLHCYCCILGNHVEFGAWFHDGSIHYSLVNKMSIASMNRPIAVISGGSRGIGRAICVDLARAGYDIAYCYRNGGGRAFDTQRQCEQAGAQVLATQCDVANADACQAWIKAIIEHFGTFDVLVNNAGITRDSGLAGMSDKDWHDVIETNLSGTFNLSKIAVFQFIKKRAGLIINISSISGVYGNPTQTNYSAAKAGMIGFSKALAKEVGAYGIRVNVVAPGFIETDMTAALSERASNELVKRIPLARFGRAEEVASMVRYLASDAGAYITGQVIQIDGGLTI